MSTLSAELARRGPTREILSMFHFLAFDRTQLQPRAPRLPGAIATGGFMSAASACVVYR